MNQAAALLKRALTLSQKADGNAGVLIVIFIHCFAHDRLKSLRWEWQRLIESVVKQVATSESLGILPVYIGLDLDHTPDLQSSAFSEAVAMVQRWRKTGTTFQGRKLPSPRKLSTRKLMGRSSKQSMHTRYLFIADELAGWVVRLLISRFGSNLPYQTVGVVFLSTQGGYQTHTSLDGLERDDGETKAAYEAYLQKLRSLSPAQGPDTNGFSSSSAGHLPEFDLPEFLAGIDEDFATFPGWRWISKVAWNTTTSYDYDGGNPQLQNRDNIEKDLNIILSAASEFVKQEAKRRSEQEPGPLKSTVVLPPEMRQELLESLFGNKLQDLSPSTRPYRPIPASRLDTPTTPTGQPAVLPSRIVVSLPAVQPPAPDKSQYQAFGANHPLSRSQTTSPYPLGHPSDSVRFFRDIRARAEACFAVGDLRSAERLFSDCNWILQSMNPPWEDAQLTVTMNHATARLYLGYYDEARCTLAEVRRRAASSRHGGSIPSVDVEIHLQEIEREADYTYCTALSRLGKYEEAASILRMLVDTDPQLAEGSTEQLLLRGKRLKLKIGSFRLLALVYAYLGHFDQPEIQDYMSKADMACEEFESHLSSAKIDATRDLQYQSTKCAVSVTRAKITMLQGDYRAAQSIIQPVLEELKAVLGVQNVLTLEASVLNSLLLIWTSRVYRGEMLCTETKKIIQDALNKNHPLAMEATHVLVVAYRAQGRIAEALGTARSLCRDAEASPSFGSTAHERSMHPQSMRYNTQLGSLLIYIGNYSEAEDKLQTTSKYATEKWSSTHPAVLRCLSELSWAQVHLEKLSQAEKCIREVLDKQLRVRFPSLGWHPKRGSSSAIDLVNDCGLIPRLEDMVASNQSKKSGSPVILHIDLLFTLYVVTQIESRKATPNLEFVRTLTSCVFRFLCIELGEDHEWTLMASLALGTVYSVLGHLKEGNQRAFHEAQKCFEFVTQRPKLRSHIEKDHPLIMVARREYVMAGLLAVNASKDLDKILRESTANLASILASQRQKPGPNHPDTLQTQLCLLSLMLSLDHTGAESVMEDLLKRLEDSNINKQRCIESLLLQERIAYVCRGSGRLETSKEVLGKLLRRVDSARLDTLDGELQRSLSQISERATISLKLVEDAIVRDRAAPKETDEK